MATIKSIAILNDAGQTINRSGATAGTSFATDILGFNVSRLKVRLEIEGAGIARTSLPDTVPARLRFRDPGMPRPPLPAEGQADAKFLLRRATPTSDYVADISLARLSHLMEQDQTPEFVTVVREGGTSDAKFRHPVIGAGWNGRGTAVLPDKGKPDITGNLQKEQPDALTLFKTGGVTIAEIFIGPGSGLDGDPGLSTWAFMRSPADVFFYSGHGLLTSGQLARSRGPVHDYQDWLSGQELLKFWKKSASVGGVPIDLDVLIINGCSVLFWNHLKEKHADRRDIGLPWSELLYTKQGPLMALLGYRYRAPADTPMGNKVAEEMGKAIAGGLGGNYDEYARTWLHINSRIGGMGWGAAAFDSKGYWYINTPTHEGAMGVPIMCVGHDPSQKPGTVMGPFPLPSA